MTSKFGSVNAWKRDEMDRASSSSGESGTLWSDSSITDDDDDLVCQNCLPLTMARVSRSYAECPEGGGENCKCGTDGWLYQIHADKCVFSFSTSLALHDLVWVHCSCCNTLWRDRMMLVDVQRGPNATFFVRLEDCRGFEFSQILKEGEHFFATPGTEDALDEVYEENDDLIKMLEVPPGQEDFLIQYPHFFNPDHAQAVLGVRSAEVRRACRTGRRIKGFKFKFVHRMPGLLADSEARAEAYADPSIAGNAETSKNGLKTRKRFYSRLIQN